MIGRCNAAAEAQRALCRAPGRVCALGDSVPARC